MPYVILPSEKVELTDSIREQIVTSIVIDSSSISRIEAAYRVELKYLHPSERDSFIEKYQGQLCLIVRSAVDSKLYYRTVWPTMGGPKDLPTTPVQVNLRLSNTLTVEGVEYRRIPLS